MANTIRHIKSDGTALLTPNTALIEVGDLLYYSASAVYPASSQADQGTESLNQQLFASRFCGISTEHSPSGTTDQIVVKVPSTNDVWSFACPSATYARGSLVGASEAASGTALEDQQVEAASNPAEAIGWVTEDYTSAVTTIRVRLFDAHTRALLAGAAAAASAAVNVQILAATKTLLATEPAYQLLDPGGASRTVTLPAEAEGLHFVIFNTADADETLTVNNDAGAAQGYVRRYGVAEFASDGTSWFERHTAGDDILVNTETLAATKTIAAGDPLLHMLDPGGAGRTVVMPTEALAQDTGIYVIANMADADETLTVYEDSSTTVLATLDRGNVAILFSDGTSWVVLGGNAISPAASTATLAGTLTMTAASPTTQVLDPDGAVRKVLLPAEAVAKGRGIYTIFNNATAGVGAAETLSVKEDSDTTFIKYLRPGESVQVISDGTNWHVIGETFGNHAQLAAQTATSSVLTLTDADMPVQRVTTPGNSIITLPAEAVTNRPFIIEHVAGAHTLAVKNDAAGTIITDVANGESALVWPDGTNWNGGALLNT